MKYVYFQGEYLPEKEAMIPISDRGFQFGDGVFATIQVRDGIPLFLEAHLNKLQTQCEALNIQVEKIQSQTLIELIERNQATKGVYRLKILVTGGDHQDLCLPKRQGRVLMMLHPFTQKAILPLKLGLFPVPFSLCHASLKSLAYLNRFYLTQQAQQQGWDDCVTTTEGGILLEAAFANLFWVVQKRLYTPDPSLPLYFGVTVQNVLKLASAEGYQIEYVKMPVEKLPSQALCFRTSAMQGVWPVAQIGDRMFGLNKQIQELFVRGYEGLIKTQRRREW